MNKQKELTMNKLTKIGASALCGSLAVVASANAGEMTVKGGATATWSSNEGTTTGNPIGLSSGITFTGTGELDNGTTFTLSLTNTDQSAYSAGQIALTTPSLGTFTIDQSGGGIDRIDDMMPTAWEETTGTSLGTGIQTINGVGSGTSVEWNIAADMLPDGLAAQVAWTPRASGNKANDKASTGDGGNGLGSGYDIVLTHTGLQDGLTVFGGYSVIEQAAFHDGDRTQKGLGATYAMGGLTVGYEWTVDNRQIVGATSHATGGLTSMYENNMYGVSFSVNDDLAISYGVLKSDRSLTDGTSVEAEAESLQLSYSMGGASLKIAETSVDDASYVSGTANDNDGTTIALTLAF